MEEFHISVGTGADDEQRKFNLQVIVVDDPEEFEEDVRGVFEPAPRTIDIDEDGDETEKIPDCIGTLRLLREEIGVGYITHELFHALIHWTELTGLNCFEIEGDLEEMLAWEIGEWNRQFWNKYREEDD